MSNSKIGNIEAIMMILTIVISHTILSLSRNLVANMKSAVIINIIYITFIALLIGYFIYKLLKKFPGSDIIDISEFLGGKILKNIIGIIFITYFIFSASILLRNFCEGLKIIYYPQTNIIFIILFFIISISLTNNLSFGTTLRTNLIIIPIVLFSIIFLFVANFKNFTPQRIYPIFGDGISNTFITGFSNIFAFGGISYLYLLPPYLKDPKKFKKITLISIAISGLYLLLCVSTLLFMFNFFVDINEIMPLYSAARNIDLGNFLQRLESLFLLIWIGAFACYLGIVSRFSLDMFKKICNISNAKPLVWILGLLIFSISLIPKDYATSYFLENNIYKYLVLAITFVISLSILILANIKKRKLKKAEDLNE